MFVESIELNNYRNFDSLKVEFSPGVNIFFGDNAQGKTNLLESIYVSGTLRSHRGSRDKELIRFGEDEAHIRLFFRKDSLSHRLDVHLKKNKSKGVAVDGVPVRRSGELLGMMHIVFFSPEDLSIIKEGPAGRRRFLDMELSQIDKGYMQQLVAYSKILNERNNLLKQINLYPALIDTLDGWDEQLLAAGQFLIKKREEFVYFLDEMMAKIHGQLTGGKEQIKVEYEKMWRQKNLESSFILKGIKIFLQGQQVSGHTEMIFDLKSGELIFVNLAHKDSKGRLRCH